MIRGLPFTTTEDVLRKDFGECGEILSLRMVYDKGFAFIKYSSKEGMTKAMAFNETDYGGRTLYVDQAVERKGGKGKSKDGKGKDGKGKGGKKGKGQSATVEPAGKKQT